LAEGVNNIEGSDSLTFCLLIQWKLPGRGPAFAKATAGKLSRLHPGRQPGGLGETALPFHASILTPFPDIISLGTNELNAETDQAEFRTTPSICPRDNQTVLMIMQPLPGGSPGPNANIPAPWRWIIIVCGILAILAFGVLFKKTFQIFEEENSKGIEQWSIEWSRKQK
jgi:hypothetical protein